MAEIETQSDAKSSLTVLVNAAVRANPMALPVPNMAARHHGGP